MKKKTPSEKTVQTQKGTNLHFVATIRVALSNVIDSQTFHDLYDNDAKAALLATFDNPVEVVMNGDRVRLVSASWHDRRTT